MTCATELSARRSAGPPRPDAMSRTRDSGPEAEPLARAGGSSPPTSGSAARAAPRRRRSSGESRRRSSTSRAGWRSHGDRSRAAGGSTPCRRACGCSRARDRPPLGEPRRLAPRHRRRRGARAGAVAALGARRDPRRLPDRERDARVQIAAAGVSVRTISCPRFFISITAEGKRSAAYPFTRNEPLAW